MIFVLKIFVTGFEKRASHNFECVDFKAAYLCNTVCDLNETWGGHCCRNEPEMKPFSLTTMMIWGGVNGIVDRRVISRKWPRYQGVCLRNGES